MVRSRSGLWWLALALVATGLTLAPPARQARTEGLSWPIRYDHVFVIVEENKDYGLVLDGRAAPNLFRLARTYGLAEHFYGEVHPSEGNYVALLGGDTFGIADDDAFYCKPGDDDPHCPGADEPGYASHTIDAPHLGDQLVARGLTWKGYYESLPTPGSLAVEASGRLVPSGPRLAALYAAKHAGFLNFSDVARDPDRAQRLVGFDQLDADLKSGQLPNFALIIPNECNEMHGLHDSRAPADCDSHNPALNVRRGDRVAGDLVARLTATDAWRSSSQNVAIVITFDESGDGSHQGCCAAVASQGSNLGGGRIATIVVTNHGPRGVVDTTPYNHYSLLRTFEDVFGIHDHLGHAADLSQGVVPMRSLFATPAPARER